MGEDAAKTTKRGGTQCDGREVVVVRDEIEIFDEERGSRQGSGLQVKLKFREVAILVPTLALFLDSIKLWGIGCCRTNDDGAGGKENKNSGPKQQSWR